MNYLDAVEYTLSVTSPVFLIVFLGLYLKKSGRIDESFIATASKLVFDFCLPILIFFSILESQVDVFAQSYLVLFSLGITLLSFLALWWVSRWWVPDYRDRGVAVQGAFRSNLGIVGLALCGNAFGSEGVAVGALLLAVVTPAYNMLSIYALSRSLDPDAKLSVVQLLVDIAKNPLIIAIFSAFLVLAIDLPIPSTLVETGQYLGAMTLPLALIAIGGSLSMTSLKAAPVLSAQVVAIKLAVIPIIVTVIAYLAGFNGVELGCLMLMFASPTAAASFVMVRAIGGNYALASNIIVLSTLLSALSVSVLLYAIRVFQWV